jgi:hypothetical protein
VQLRNNPQDWSNIEVRGIARASIDNPQGGKTKAILLTVMGRGVFG